MKFHCTKALTVFASLLALPALAHADQWPAGSPGARTAQDLDQVAQALWSQTATCDKAQDDLQRRQCRQLVAARKLASHDSVYLVPADDKALEVGAWDAQKQQIVVKLRGCVDCTDKTGPELASAVVKLPDQAAADQWLSDVAPRLRAQIAVKVPAAGAAPRGAKKTHESEIDGHKVELVAYRLFDPCQGTVLAASHDSDALPATDVTCSAEPAPDADPAESAAPRLKRRLSTRQIQTAMKPTEGAVQRCFATYQVRGTARLAFGIEASGTMTEPKLLGDFAGTPTGDCILEATRGITFPVFDGPDMPVTFPFILR